MKYTALSVAALSLVSHTAMAQVAPNPSPEPVGPITYANIVGQVVLDKKGGLCNVFAVQDSKGWRVSFASPDSDFWASVVAHSTAHDTVRIAWGSNINYSRTCPDPYGPNMVSLTIPNAIEWMVGQ